MKARSSSDSLASGSLISTAMARRAASGLAHVSSQVSEPRPAAALNDIHSLVVYCRASGCRLRTIVLVRLVCFSSNLSAQFGGLRVRCEQRRETLGIAARHAALGGYAVNPDVAPGGGKASGVAGYVQVGDLAAQEIAQKGSRQAHADHPAVHYGRGDDGDDEGRSDSEELQAADFRVVFTRLDV